VDGLNLGRDRFEGPRNAAGLGRGAGANAVNTDLVADGQTKPGLTAYIGVNSGFEQAATPETGLFRPPPLPSRRSPGHARALKSTGYASNALLATATASSAAARVVERITSARRRPPATNKLPRLPARLANEAALQAIA
jgi:hypothetical protein